LLQHRTDHLLSTLAQFAITYVPVLQTIFATESVPFWDGLLVIAIGVVLFAVVETEKQVRLHLRAINARGSESKKIKG
jgi:integral membrane sensor domain MASE1